jgi:glycine hydroxymethyltransferase
MNMLPHEALSRHDHPDGIRIGVQEMTRFGMGTNEMETIAELMKECIVDNKEIKSEVHAFRAQYTDVKYSFDDRQ